MYYNCHIHIFTEKDVPNKFLPLGLVNLLRTKLGYIIITGIMKNVFFWTKNDVLDRYARFVTTGRLGSQQMIFEKCKDYYPDDTSFIVLPMDMAFMGAGKVPRPYIEQLEDLHLTCIKYPQIIPFIHVDPRREGVLELVKKCVEEWNFKGIKLYPPLGVFPYDKSFDPIYEYCQEKNLPIIAHCSPYNPVHYKGSMNKLKKLLAMSDLPIDTKGKNKKELCSYFTHPENYKKVVERFPRLRICLAHFGSQYYWGKFIHNPREENNWFRIIREMCVKYENFYTDISFTMSEPKYFALLKVSLTDKELRKKVLFGSDYYMVQVESDERRFGLELRGYLGEEDFNQIAIENPQAFL
jgi:uncharacterized protein